MKRSIEDLSPTTTRENASLLSLHDDALMTVLLRTRASDHANLRRSCKRIRDMIDSFQFRKERGVQGFAEVDVDLLSGFEQYQLSKKSLGEHPPSEEDDSFYAQYDTLGYIYEYGDYSFETDCFRVFVDGRPLHKLRRREEFNLHVRLLPLCAPFWELCDCYNQTLCDLGTLLFTNKGKPKVASIKNALTCDDFCASHNLLYIQDFVLPFEYRFIESTVGPLLIKGVLKLFLDFYSITMYVPYRETQFTVEEADAERNTRFRFDEEKTDEDIQAEEERQIRNDRCKHQDMRQFFRAGFQQVNDQLVVEKSDYSYVFAIPEVTGEPILSLEETLKIPIARKTPTDQSQEQICEWNVMTEELKDLRIPPLEKPLFAQMIDDFNGNVQQLKDQEDGLSNSIQERAQMDKDVSTLEESREIVRTSRRDLEEKINTLSLNRKEAEMKTWQDKARKDLKTVLEKAENTLQLFYESDAIHVAAAGKNLDLLLMLLEFVPDSDRPMAVNALDRLGLTPLMVLATIAPSAGLTKCRQTMEAVINMGADTSIVHSINGLSALGHFRDSHEQEERHRILFGLPEPSVELKEEVVRIEALLRPADGPTAADEAILETRKDADSNDDESDY